MQIADTIVLRPVEYLIPYARNARTHSPEQVAQIAASIAEFGFTNPVLIDEAGGIIAGHGRVLAAERLHMAAVPTIELAWLTEAQRRAYRIADNKLALNAGWDVELLRLELSELKDFGFPLAPIGFSDGELSELFADRTEGLSDPDDVPPLPEEPVSRAGDLWILGRHRLLCGDATSATDVTRILDSSAPHLMVTDPPYGVEYDATWRDTKGEFARRGFRPGPVKMRGPIENDRDAEWAGAWTLFPGDVIYVWHADRHASAIQISLEAASFEIRCQLIWVKQHLVMSRGDYHWQHEPCWYAVRKGAAGHWSGDRTQTTIWNIESLNPVGRKGATGYGIDEKLGHSTQKPVECMRRPIENNSSLGQAVYDPFVGSGTTVIAAEMTGRACYAIEIAPAYIDVAVKRWQRFTGKTGFLDGDGRSFAVIAEARREGVPAAPVPVQARKRAAG